MTLYAEIHFNDFGTVKWNLNKIKFHEILYFYEQFCYDNF